MDAFEKAHEEERIAYDAKVKRIIELETELEEKEKELTEVYADLDAINNSEDIVEDSEWVLPCKNYIEMTGNTGPEYNGYDVPSYEAAVGHPHSGVDIVASDYTAIADGVVVRRNAHDRGGYIIVEYPYSETEKLWQIMYHGKPLKYVGDKVTKDDYITDSRIPDWASMDGMSAHTHFELRLVPINQGFSGGDGTNWWYYKQMEQSFDPLTLCTKRHSDVLIGNRMKEYMAAFC